ncbi:MAG TPA: tripartite tricarboxylate transporter substrate-binding protein [Xanthobacteraceae bacterium]|nr:tripartite tricarboxylate transporter substrate-binding protein [Xanthobacteraceae bacterium]
MPTQVSRRRLAQLALGGIAIVTAMPAQAEPAADFYRGKSISLVIGNTVGNDYDYRARLLARHIGKHIPGNPAVVPRNMPGAGGLVAANWMAKLAPQDGTSLFMIASPHPAGQAMALPNVQYDVRAFHWIGNTIDTPNVINAWHTSDVRTIADAMQRELVLGGTTGTNSVVYPAVLNALVGTHFKVVTGYPGGGELNLAMERGEIQGRGSNSWASWKSTKPQWLAEKKIIILVQIALKRAADLPDVPLLLELAKNDFDRKVLTFLSADTAISRAVVTTPNVPADRVEVLRRAFDATMRDKAFLAEAAEAKMDIVPSTGEVSQQVAQSIIDTDPAVVARARDLVNAVAK